MSVHLLDKTRRISSFLRNNNDSKVSFNEFCQILAECTMSGVVVISKKGKILDQNKEYVEKISIASIQQKIGCYIDNDINRRFMDILSTNENANLNLMGIELEETSKIKSMIIPVYISGNRLGTVIIYRDKKSYGIEDIITAEYAATVIALEMSRAIAEEDSEEQRKRNCISACVYTFSELEKKAAETLLETVANGDTYVVISKVAREADITRSIFVNVIRKMESAGIVQSKSAGVKGTHIKILNEYLVDTLKNN